MQFSLNIIAKYYKISEFVKIDNAYSKTKLTIVVMKDGR